jgi:iron(III) transport system ATP-binding protein
LSAGIEIRQVTKRYGDARSPLVVKGIDLVVPRGTLTTILGPSGCGKTTTLRMIAGLRARPPPARSSSTGATSPRCAPGRSQRRAWCSRATRSFPHMTVLENVGFGLSVRGRERAEAQRRARAAMLKVVGLAGYEARMPARAFRRPAAARGGGARARAASRSVMLFDEPLSNLDARLRRSMREEIRALQQRLGLTVVYVTHDQSEALAVSDQIVVMARRPRGPGRHARASSTSARRTEFVAGFMGEAMLFDGMGRADGSVQLGPLALRPATGAPAGALRLAVRPQACRSALRPKAPGAKRPCSPGAWPSAPTSAASSSSPCRPNWARSSSSARRSMHRGSRVTRWG